MDTTLAVRRPSQAVVDVMSNEKEIKRFEIWKNTAGSDLHPELGEDAKYDRQRAVWKGTPTAELEKVLNSAQKLYPDSSFTGCTWESLVNHIDAALEADEEKAAGNKLRKGFRSSQSDIKFLDSLLSTIPDEKGLSLLRGGLSFIFTMWNQRIQNREQVLESLAEVVRSLASGEENRRLFPKDQQLSQVLRELYCVMLDATQGLIDILLHTHKGSVLQRVRKQLPTHEAERLRKITLEVNVYNTKLSERVQFLSLEQQSTIYKTGEIIRCEVQATRFRLSNIETHVSHIIDRMDESYKQSNAREEEFIRLFRDNFHSELSNIKEIQTSIFQFIGESIATQKLGWLPQRKHLHPNQQLEYQPRMVSFAQIISELKVDPTPMLQETQVLMRKANMMESEGLAHVRHLVSTTPFRDWMSSVLPTTLLVDGYCRDAGLGRTSPLSVFCASFAATLAHTNQSIPLHFFCGNHSIPGSDPLSGPSGLLKGLIAQLILYPKATNVEAVAMEQNLWEGIARFDVPALMALFERILMQVDSEKTVYCIIDSISDYQSVIHNWVDPTLYVLQSLHRLADRRDQPPQLKLLMTSANRTKDVPLIVSRASGEYVALRSGRSDERPIRGQAFDRDIHTLMRARSYNTDSSSP